MPQMVDGIEIWGIWRPNRSNFLLCSAKWLCMVYNNTKIRGTSQSDPHGRQDPKFLSCPKHHTPFFLQCGLVPGIPQVSKAPSYPCHLKGNVIHQNRPPSPFALWSNSEAHVPAVYAFGSGQGSAWALWLVRGYAAPHTTTCDVLCILTPFYQNQFISWIGSYRPLPSCVMTLSLVHHWSFHACDSTHLSAELQC